MQWIVPTEQAGERLDKALAEAVGMSRSFIAVRVDCGDVTIDGRAAKKPSARLKGGQTIELTVPPPLPSEAIPEDLPLSVVYEDAHLVVVNKAPDMVVHPSPGHETGTLVNALLHRYSVLAPDTGTEDGRPRPGIVHRLDKGTSGLLVVARDVAARDGLSRMLAGRDVHRTYLAIVHGQKLLNCW